LQIKDKMATILDKDIVRETTIKVDGREILVSLTTEQKISLKLKGMKSGVVEISIGDLYNQLTGVKVKKEISFDNEVVEDTKQLKNDLSSYKGDSKYLISIHDIRHAANIKEFDLETTAKFDSFLNELIKERKNRQK
jgi:hypothetical protein